MANHKPVVIPEAISDAELLTDKYAGRIGPFGIVVPWTTTIEGWGVPRPKRQRRGHGKVNTPQVMPPDVARAKARAANRIARRAARMAIETGNGGPAQA